MRHPYISLILPLVCGVAGRACSRPIATFSSYASVKPVLDAAERPAAAELRNPNEAKWTAWSEQQDKAIRARLRQGDLDSMVNLLFYGTSFTKQPRIKSKISPRLPRPGFSGPGGRFGRGSAQSRRQRASEFL